MYKPDESITSVSLYRVACDDTNLGCVSIISLSSGDIESTGMRCASGFELQVQEALKRHILRESAVVCLPVRSLCSLAHIAMPASSPELLGNVGDIKRNQ